MIDRVILCSGGLKSAVLAAVPRQAGEALLLFFDHGQPQAERQWRAIQKIAKAMAIPHTLALAFQVGRPPQDNGHARHGSSGWSRRAPAARALRENLFGRAEAAPGGTRGILPAMACLAASVASDVGAKRLILGISQVADEAQTGVPFGLGRPDHRRISLQALQILMETAMPRSAALRVEAPWMDLTLGEVVRVGLRWNAPLGVTWSCHEGRAEPCGLCRGCKGRRSAFAESSNLLGWSERRGRPEGQEAADRSFLGLA